MRLKSKVAIITGGAQGIGEAITKRFASEGAAVVIADLNLDKASQVAYGIKGQGGQAVAFKVDVSVRAEVQEVVKEALNKFKVIHILVNDAGIDRNVPLLEETEKGWDSVMGVNLKGTFNFMQAVLPYMVKERYGKIVNLSSCMGVGVPGPAAYGATKAAIVQLTKNTAMEVGPFGINVNAIAPGLVVTDMVRGRMGVKFDEWIADRAQKAALGRVLKPEDIANLALFLASDESSQITGQVIRCDAGRHDLM